MAERIIQRCNRHISIIGDLTTSQIPGLETHKKNNGASRVSWDHDTLPRKTWRSNSASNTEAQTPYRSPTPALRGRYSRPESAKQILLLSIPKAPRNYRAGLCATSNTINTLLFPHITTSSKFNKSFHPTHHPPTTPSTNSTTHPNQNNPTQQPTRRSPPTQQCPTQCQAPTTQPSTPTSCATETLSRR